METFSASVADGSLVGREHPELNAAIQDRGLPESGTGSGAGARPTQAGP